jgi:hypothetical protein
MPLLKKAIENGDAGRYVVEIIDTVWCEMTEQSRATITKVLASDLPYGNDTVGINEIAKSVLENHSKVPCTNQ